MLDDMRLQAITANLKANEVRRALKSGLSLVKGDFLKPAYCVKWQSRDELEYISLLDQRLKECSEQIFPFAIPPVVELSIVAIHAGHIPELVSGFLEFVRSMQSPAIGLFSGDGLSTAIRHVHITESGDETRLPSGLFDILRSALDIEGHGLVEKRHGNYDSVDLVCSVSINSSPRTEAAPVSVKFRTVFEDVWLNLSETAKSATNGIPGIDDRLTALKDDLDRCSRDIESVSREIDGIAPPGDVARTSDYRIPIQIPRLARLRSISAEAPRDIQAEMSSLEGRLSRIYARNSNASLDPLIIDQIAPLIAELETIGKSYSERSRDLWRNDIDFKVSQCMEKGVAYYWMARAVSGQGLIDRSQESYLSKAEGMFITAEQLDPGNPIIYFRQSICYALSNQFPISLEKLASAYDFLQADSLPADSVFRAIIPRQYFYMLWNNATNLIKQSVDLAEDRLKQQALDHLLRAIIGTVEYLNHGFEGLEQAYRDREIDSFRNNLLSYVTIYIEQGGLQEKLNDEGVTTDYLREQIRLFGPGLNGPQHLDTKARLFHLLKETSLAQQAARALEALLHDPTVRPTLNKKELEYAQETIRLCLYG